MLDPMRQPSPLPRSLPVSGLLLALSVYVFIPGRSSWSSLSRCAVVVWSTAQWSPTSLLKRGDMPGWAPLERVHRWAWALWEDQQERRLLENAEMQHLRLQVPVVDVQTHRSDIVNHLERTYGKDWRQRPLLLRRVWTSEELGNSSRKLSLKGLLQQNMSIPYFSDARLPSALTPDAVGAVSSIVANISEKGMPHKIASQLVIQAFPELLNEVAPQELVTSLFGDYFSHMALQGSGPFGIFPPLTTVPLFVAWKRPSRQRKHSPDEIVSELSPRLSDADAVATGRSAAKDANPYTALHCEPIGNVAVQLSGRKHWTLIDPVHWHLVRPHLAPDGRAFFASALLNESLVPTYQVITEAGDALWIPTWTWHRVVYQNSDEIAIGASLFHFRFRDFLRNQPLFAFLIVPALIMELTGYKTQ